ncbi:hypothetical protein C1646_679942 [Rhizophagus diaphanus]|nr:hypothetical protein C1646_679942 [Rhizophagus diaphanus] [Rhizophagus sp. MUCL 43196]
MICTRILNSIISDIAQNFGPNIHFPFNYLQSNLQHIFHNIQYAFHYLCFYSIIKSILVRHCISP